MKPSPTLAVLVTITLTASAVAQAPTGAQLSDLRLHDGFTLVYQVTVRDVRTPALRQKEVADQQAGVAKEEATGHIVQSMRSFFEKQALELGQTRTTERFTITLSARDGKLLYLSTRPARYLKDGTKIAIVLDGSKEYESDDPSGGIINNDGWRNAPAYAGENVDRLAFCPLPGVGLPDVDLIQSPLAPSRMPNGHFLYAGLVPRLNLINGETPYKAGSIEAVSAKGRLKVVGLIVGTAAAPQQIWQITGYQFFQGHWLGAQMRWTEYKASLANDGEKLTSDLPTTVADYQLVESRPAALELPAFEIGTYLSGNAVVSDSSTGSTVVFAYDKRGGTLEEQAAGAIKKNPKKIGKPLDSGCGPCHTISRCRQWRLMGMPPSKNK